MEVESSVAGIGKNHFESTNFDTTKMTVVAYPAGAGGKFLSACLGLSDQVFLNDEVTAEAQVRGEMTQLAKYNMLKSRISLQQLGEWNDMELGFPQFHTRGLAGTTVLHPNLKRYFKGPKSLQLVVESNLFMFFEAARWDVMERQYKIWPNARTIYFVNAYQWMKVHRPRRYNPLKYQHWAELNSLYSQIKHSNWPPNPPESQQDLERHPWDRIDMADYHRAQLVELLYDEVFLDEYHTTEESVMVDQACQRANSYAWNCDWFLSQNEFLKQVSNLYEIYGLDDFNKDFVGELYSIWMIKSKDI